MPDKTIDNLLWVETLVSQATREPVVVVRWYDHSGQFTPLEARKMAMTLLEAADASESDAFLLRYVKEQVGADEKGQMVILREFRKYREEQAAR